MFHYRLIAWMLAVLLCGTGTALTAWAQPAPPPAQVARESIQTLKVQAQLPSQTPNPQPLDLPWRPIVEFIALLIAIAAAALLAFWLVRLVMRILGKDQPVDLLKPIPGQDLPVNSADSAQDTAEALARAGRYTEAMHRLLLDAVDLLRPRVTPPLPDSLTSRELLRDLPLSPGEQSAFSSMVHCVERSWFGLQPAGPDAFETVLENYRTLRTAASSGRPAS